MKNLLFGLVMAAGLTYTFSACNKNKNYYAVTDYTVGMVNTRNWQGYAYGYAKGDTIIGADTVDWPKRFYRTLDTNFNLLRVNSFALNAAGTRLIFRSVDSVTKLLIYDSTFANSPQSFLRFDYGKDTMHLEIYHNDEFHTPTGKYYQTNFVLRSTH